MSVFAFQDGIANPIRKIITNATAVDVVVGLNGKGVTRIAYFEVNENTGAGTPVLTVSFVDSLGNITYPGDSVTNTVWIAKAMTAGQSVKFQEGYVLNPGEVLRVKSGDAAGKINVIGVKHGANG